MNKIPLFVFVCDSYFEQNSINELRQFALIEGKNFDHSGAGGATGIFSQINGMRQVDAEHLLVFTGSFHGDVGAAINYAKKIKDANPKAKVYFRSMTDDSIDPVFDGSLYKGNKERFHEIIRDFVTEARQPAP